MDIQIHSPFKAQPLDEDGDPIGRVLTLEAGAYELRSITREDDGGTLAWVARDGRLYETREIKVGG